MTAQLAIATGRRRIILRRPAVAGSTLRCAALLGGAAALYALDGVTTLAALAVVPGAYEVNPVAALVISEGPLAVATMKAAIIVQVVASVIWLRGAGAPLLGNFVAVLLGVAGAWGVGSAFLIGWRP